MDFQTKGIELLALFFLPLGALPWKCPAKMKTAHSKSMKLLALAFFPLPFCAVANATIAVLLLLYVPEAYNGSVPYKQSFWGCVVLLTTIGVVTWRVLVLRVGKVDGSLKGVWPVLGVAWMAQVVVFGIFKYIQV